MCRYPATISFCLQRSGLISHMYFAYVSLFFPFEFTVGNITVKYFSLLFELGKKMSNMCQFNLQYSNYDIITDILNAHSLLKHAPNMKFDVNLCLFCIKY